MKTDFKFSNLLGTVYCQGNLLFSPDGTHLFSPVGNRVTVFNLVDNKSYTLPFSHRKNIARIGLTPQGNLLLSIDEDGQAILTNVPRRVVLYHFSFKAPVTALSFSPSGRHFIVGLGRKIEVWHVPSTPDANADGELEFAPFVKHHTHVQHFDDVRHIEWSHDSRFFLTSSKDLTARIWSVDQEEGFTPTVLSGHRQGVVGAWFSKDQETIYTVSKDGAVFDWQYVAKPGQDEDMVDDDDLAWRIVNKHYFMQNSATVRCAAFHPESNLLVAGFSNGIFGLYEMPDFNMIHTLSISQNEIDFVTINKSGEWLAFGASKLGQLLVWEWQSESYILKQQGHFDSMNSLVYSPDGQRIVTVADDGKIKVWDTESGFCIVTFTEHTSGITACEFSKKGNVLFTSSLDGSIRAWDLIRYRNFRTFTAPERLSFSCMAVDPSGEIVAAGSVDSFDIHIWSVQTGQLLDRLSGHEGPVSSLAFAPNGGLLVSGSWDRTARIWSIFNRTQTSEPLQLNSDVLDIAFRPDSLQIAISTLDGNLSFWSVSEAEQQAGLDGRRDVSGGRKIGDRRTAANVAGTKAFNTIRYSTDGSCLLAGGNSKYICLYSVTTMVLLKKYTVSVNLSIQGTQEFLNSKLLTEAGPQGLLDEQGEASDFEDRIDRSLPGSKRGDPSARRKNPEVRVNGVAFSPNGSAFCAASTEGLLIYSLDTTIQFDPFDLNMEITPTSTLAVLEKEKDYLKALVMAFRLNEAGLIQRVFQAIPYTDIPLVVEQFPNVYVARLLRYVAAQTEQSPHVEFCLLWIKALVDKHGAWLSANRGKVDVELRVVARAVSKMRDEIRKLADENVYMVDYLLGQASAAKETNTTKTLALEWATTGSDEQPGAGGMSLNDVMQQDEGNASEDEWIGLV
ncbi:periodic tryptophan protein 2 [Neurospora crassa]|uniref:Periodic tryptophan protein 2 homolog n=1 Tax=Neurospora crassa (strain ATCC 24698 / 74-OR23-1A / CBS 708.71 / DSM 1257 / FGSC 987) TaxID=367110 RepID=PWP2_NEUCR|nr:periodic tryptophan protein 2 [Neurospora crassa OR74A]Q9C270.1 RecName: Full=Periodic tryptophan protein 2 homolog [Neurospora crassa OR74A]EAA31947.1 periodic tryptophan protein 2 [Neurospora crassa OR74A]KHE88138.1 periodic tryptophan protein 2 [Neurospora crassa]CAC28802.1 probable periodic tryptophan protein PWP2 [Neurospora crassa]|eukprot:XP_961183.1 periodic tryptophan protein 2 [Neurospora crassa OR74A]